MKIVFFLIIGCCVLSGCSNSLEKQIWNNIAEIREFVVYGKDEGVSVSLICGRRESEYKMNGYATDLIPFGVLTITYDNIDALDISEAKYTLYVGTEKFVGDLVQNPFDQTLVADIGTIVNKDANISVDIWVENKKTSLKLKNIDEDWGITSSECIDILIEHYKNQLKSFVNDEFMAEVYIKIMNDYDMYGSDFYYYVSVIGRSGSSLSMIISPKTGDILASNSNIVPKVE